MQKVLDFLKKTLDDFTNILTVVLNLKTCSTTFYSTIITIFITSVLTLYVVHLIQTKQYINSIVLMAIIPTILLLLSYFFTIGKNTTNMVKTAEQDMTTQKESDRIMDTESEMNKLVEDTVAIESNKTIEEKFTIF